MRSEHSHPNRPELETLIGRAFMNIFDRDDLIPELLAGEPKDNETDQRDDREPHPLSWRACHTV